MAVAYADEHHALQRVPTSALSLIWAVLELASRGWRAITMTPKAAAHIERLRRGQPPRSTPTTDAITEEGSCSLK